MLVQKLRVHLISTAFICLLAQPAAFTQAQNIDILLKGGHVIDPKNNIDKVMDVAIVDNKISQVTENIPITNAKKVIDAKGMYVTPGLVDMHVHVYPGNDLDAYIAN
ncbi:MAG TPA: amidohydrolase family protein, partial [Chryseolinea sp.]